MNKLKIARLIVTMSTDVGAEIAINHMITRNVPMHRRLPIRFCQHLGRFGFMMAGGSLAAKYVGQTFDELVAAFKGDPTKANAYLKNLN